MSDNCILIYLDLNDTTFGGKDSIEGKHYLFGTRLHGFYSPQLMDKLTRSSYLTYVFSNL